MARLSKATKEEILKNAIIKSGVVEREFDLRKRRAELADKVRLHAIGGEEEEAKLLKLQKKVRSLMAGVKTAARHDFRFDFNSAYCIPAAFGGMSIMLRFSGNQTEQLDRANNSWVKKSITPYQYGDPIKFSADHELTYEFNSIETEAKTVKDLRESITLNVNAMLNSVTTDKKLLAIWPESLELIPKEKVSASVNLPTTDVQSLNAAIGIPSGDK